ncbi:hypothetical protein RR48_07919 [Papilio machaon]|uniref:Uncharacterized protein n=1 Tax=Papilio machaon TaxID=76193 RepID=A0A194QNI5_PAPMA|nr:hypothetical protein RR48_07919 [Papilio machaon]
MACGVTCGVFPLAAAASSQHTRREALTPLTISSAFAQQQYVKLRIIIAFSVQIFDPAACGVRRAACGVRRAACGVRRAALAEDPPELVLAVHCALHCALHCESVGLTVDYASHPPLHIGETVNILGGRDGAGAGADSDDVPVAREDAIS